MNDDLFDKMIKEKLKDENDRVPHYVNNAFDKAINKCKERKYKFKKRAGVIAACLAGTIIITTTIPTFAGDLPIFNKIVDFFTYSRYKNYDKYASDLNITKESNGIKVTINKVVYDGLDLEVFYTIESEKELDGIPTLVGSKTKINGKEVSFGHGGSGEILDSGKVCVGSVSYGVNGRAMVPKELQEESFYGGYVDIPDEFVFLIEINSFAIKDRMVNGNWEFEIPVTNELVKGKVKEQDVNIGLSNINNSLNINKIITTPINTAIQGTYEGEEWTDVDFIVFDNKGRYLSNKSGSGFGTRVKDDKYINYFGKQFEEIYEDTESLTFIPYKYEALSSEGKTVTIGGQKIYKDDKVTVTTNVNSEDNTAPFKLNEKLNLNGQTKLNNMFDEEYGTITKIEVGNGKTKLYIKSNYNVFVAPRMIIDKDTGKEILPVDNFDMMELKTTKYLKDTGELVVEYDGELLGDNYEVIYYDHTNQMKFYNTDSFIVEIK